MFKVPEKKTQQRLATWRKLRQQLENSTSPLEDVAEFFNQFPKIKVYTDPYDQLTWPTAWELIEENEYCPFNTLLGICYTIQLCDRFDEVSPSITISLDTKSNTVYYLLYVDKMVYGYKDGEWFRKNNLPKSLKILKNYLMPSLN